MTNKPTVQESKNTETIDSTRITREPDYFPEVEPDELPEPIGDDPAFDFDDEAVVYADDPGYDDSEYPDSATYQPAPFVTHTFNKNDVRCTRCGSPNLTRGYVVDYAGKFEQVRFATKRSTFGWINRLFDFRPFKTMIRLEAEACRDCGAVIMVIDPSRLRRAVMRRR